MEPLEMALSLYTDALRDVFGNSPAVERLRADMRNALRDAKHPVEQDIVQVRSLGLDPTRGLGRYLIDAAAVTRRNALYFTGSERDIVILNPGFRVGTYVSDRESGRSAALALLLEGTTTPAQLRKETGWNSSFAPSMQALARLVEEHSQTHRLVPVKSGRNVVAYRLQDI